MKPILPPIRQNVFLVAHHSAFLELSTLQKGPIVPFSVTTPLLDAFCVLSGVALRVPTACPLLFASGLSALSLVVCDPSPALMLVAFPWRSLLCVRVTPPPAVPLWAYAISLLPYAESPLRLLRR